MNENQPLNPNPQNDNQSVPPQPPLQASQAQVVTVPPVAAPGQSPTIENQNQQNQYGAPQPVLGADNSRGMFHGRIGRLGYFLGPLYAMLPLLVLLVLLFVFVPLIGGGSTGGSNPISTVLSVVVYLLAAVFMVLYILAVISLHIRRLHDLNLSWVWILLAFVPIASFFFGLYLLFAPGNKGVNQYGEPVSSLDFLTVLGFKQPK